jgi:hypothetical protein
VLIGLDHPGGDHLDRRPAGPYLMGLAIDTYIATGDLPGLARLLG